MSRILDDRLIYRHASLDAYHPSVVCLSDLDWIVTHDLGSSTDALDYRTQAIRTCDGGESWEVLGCLLEGSVSPATHTIRVRRMKDGRLVGFGKYEDRSEHRERRCNEKTFGQVPMRLFWIASRDGGKTWTPPNWIKTPIAGPTWELCHSIVELPDGSWGAPVATWRDWDGALPEGEQSLILISRDQGASWKEYGRTFDGRKSGFIHWEQSVVNLGDGTVLAVAWVFDPKTGKTHPNVFTISSDGGRTFGAPAQTGFFAQTCKLLTLEGNRIAAAYRRHDEPGLWMEFAEVGRGRWQTLERFPLWLGTQGGVSDGESVAMQLQTLQFGFPSMAKLDADRILVVFWCREGGRTNIRGIVVQCGKAAE